MDNRLGSGVRHDGKKEAAGTPAAISWDGML